MARALFTLGFFAECDTAILDKAVKAFGYVFVVGDEAGGGIFNLSIKARMVVDGVSGVVIGEVTIVGGVFIGVGWIKGDEFLFFG